MHKHLLLPYLCQGLCQRVRCSGNETDAIPVPLQLGTQKKKTSTEYIIHIIISINTVERKVRREWIRSFCGNLHQQGLIWPKGLRTQVCILTQSFPNLKPIIDGWPWASSLTLRILSFGFCEIISVKWLLCKLGVRTNWVYIKYICLFT